MQAMRSWTSVLFSLSLSLAGFVKVAAQRSGPEEERSPSLYQPHGFFVLALGLRKQAPMTLEDPAAVIEDDDETTEEVIADDEEAEAAASEEDEKSGGGGGGGDEAHSAKLSPGNNGIDMLAGRYSDSSRVEADNGTPPPFRSLGSCAIDARRDPWSKGIGLAGYKMIDSDQEKSGKGVRTLSESGEFGINGYSRALAKSMSSEADFFSGEGPGATEGSGPLKTKARRPLKDATYRRLG